VTRSFARQSPSAATVRAFTIARAEALEAFAALEVAAIVGDTETADLERCLLLTHRLYALLSGLLR
jgi:hypothetical protein